MAQLDTSNSLDYEAIRNTISWYCIALDSKKFEMLNDVFTKDVNAKYPFGDGFDDCTVLADAIRKRLWPVVTQHALTTQTITLASDGKTAHAVTYFTGVHLGQGRWTGQLVTAYGKYIDKLVCFVEQGSETIHGASGKWLISEREVVFMGRIGEEGVMKGEHD